MSACNGVSERLEFAVQVYGDRPRHAGTSRVYTACRGVSNLGGRMALRPVPGRNRVVETQRAASRASMALMSCPAMSTPNAASSSRTQVGLVTLITVR